MQCWLLKVEPSDYPWSKMKKDKTTTWNGIRNHQAQKYLRTMKIGDMAYFYHTEKERAIVGIVKVCKEYYIRDDDPKFGVVDVECYEELDSPVQLSAIKGNSKLSGMTLLKQPRLSVSPVTEKQWDIILDMSKEDEADTD